VLSYRWGDSAAIGIMAPVSTVDRAVACAAAGATLVDVGAAEALIPAIRRAAGGLLICGRGEDADLVRDVNLAARTGAGLICRDLAAARAAVGHRIAPDRILVWCAPAQIERAAESGWATLVDVDVVAGSVAGVRADAGSLVDVDAVAGSVAGVPADAGSLVDVDTGAGSVAGVLAVAAVCGWLGASVIWTRHVAGVRRALDMTETIRGTRPPAWTVRGLA
jgi:dihydropteroate synthase